MAVWRRKAARGKVLIHSDKASQFTSIDWALFLKHHTSANTQRAGAGKLAMDNAVAESFFSTLLKR